MYDGGFKLHDYQRAAADAAENENLLIVLPTNSGKTIIAAEKAFVTLKADATKKVVFITPKRTLAMQQAKVLLRHIGPLHMRSDETSTQRRNEPRWRLAIAASASSLREDTGELDMVHWRHAFAGAQCVVTTAELFDRALTHGAVGMSDVALLILDEAHALRGNSQYVTIMKYFYRPASERPRVLGLTASPIEKAETKAPNPEDVIKGLNELQAELDARVWSKPVAFGERETKVVQYDAPAADAPLERSLQAIINAVGAARPSGDRELEHGWSCCISKVTNVGSELGTWAAMRAARMLANDLCSGLLRLEQMQQHWFQRAERNDDDGGEEDEKETMGGRDALKSGPRKRRAERLVRVNDAEAEERALRILSAAGRTLHVALDALPAQELSAPGAVTSKVLELLNELGTRQPRKCLLFVQRRLSCRVLTAMLERFTGGATASADELGHALRGWPIGWVMSVGALGVAQGRAGERMCLDAQTASIADFRRHLRLLVATSIVEEGIDVPECDAVISFDAAGTSRELQQRRGRARAPSSAYVSLLPRAKPGAEENAVQGQSNLNEWNRLVDEQLHGGREELEPPAPLGTPEAELQRVRADALLTAGGALLPLERAKAFLQMVYLETITLPGSAEPIEINTTGDGSKFSSKAHHGNNFVLTRTADDRFTCTLHLPFVAMCSAEGLQTTSWPVTLEPSQPEASKTKAFNRAALDGCIFLHKIGVLDDQLFVVGRDDARTRLLRGQQHVSTRRANAYELSSKEPIVRSVRHACFQPPLGLPPTDAAQPAAGAGALEAGGAADDVHVWLHPVRLDDDQPACIGLLLGSPCPMGGRAFLVGAVCPDGKARRQCTLGAPTRVLLGRAALQKLARWQVGTFDLLQGGNAGEPLHSSLRAPRQLVAFQRERGTFAAQEVAWDSDALQPRHGTMHRTPAAKNSLEARWQQAEASAASLDERVERLADLIGHLVAPTSPQCIVLVFDLDHTLWMGRCDEWSGARLEPLDNSALQVTDAQTARILDLFPDVPLIFAALHRAGAPIAIASASTAKASARALLCAFGLIGRPGLPEPFIEMASGAEVERTSKVGQLTRLSNALNVPLEQMLLLDDSKPAVDSVRKPVAEGGADCGALLLSGESGLRAVDLLRGLDMYSGELQRRRKADIDESGFTKEERAEPDYEKRRKMQQARRGREGGRQAEADVAPAEERLKQLQSHPAFWLAAPLTRPPNQSHGAGAGDDAHLAIDWAFVDEALAMMHTCNWAQLGAPAEHPLVTRARRPSVAGDTYGLDLCALVTVRPGEKLSHANLLENVLVSPTAGVSGDKVGRSVNVSGAAATRMLQTDGTHKTTHSLRTAGHELRNVEVLPLHVSQLPVLRILRRIVWRLEHLVPLVEMAEGPAQMTAPPMTAVNGEAHGTPCSGLLMQPLAAVDCQPMPLALLASAFTSKGASAEAMARVDGTGATDVDEAAHDQFFHDERGCCHYEVAEWLGDAVLDLLAKAHVMAEKHAESENKLNPQAEQILRNLNLRQRAIALELPPVGLFAPFIAARWLPDMRRALVSKKEQADLVEALLGVVAEAQLAPPPDAAHIDGDGTSASGVTTAPLGRAFTAALAFFHAHVHPAPLPPASAGDHAAAFLRRTMPAVNDSRHATALDAHGARALEVAGKLGFKDELELRRRDLLLECCVWSRGIVFQRLEFLGDAFLQFAVSMELRQRYPDKTHGELTSIRSALVRNVHLGRLLTRRYGVEATLAFFAEVEGEKGCSLREFVQTVPPRHSAADVSEAVLGAAEEAEAEEVNGGGAPAGASAALHHHRREDPRKPTGDMYEALVGWVLLELDGDVDSTWRVFELDFFPPASAAAEAEHSRRLDQALKAARRRLAEKELERKMVRERSRAERLSRQQEAQTQARGAAPEPVPMEVAPTEAQPAAAPAQEAPDTNTRHLEALVAADEQMAADPNHNYVGKLHNLLVKNRLDPTLMLEEQPRELEGTRPMWSCALRWKRSSECLGESSGHAHKKVAKKVAYYLAYHNPRLQQAVAEEAALHMPPPPAAPPPPPPVARPLPATPSTADNPISKLHHRVQIAGLNPSTYLQWGKEKTVEGNATQWTFVLTSSDGTHLGEGSGSSQQEAKAEAARRALEHLNSSAPSLLSPIQRVAAPSSSGAPPAGLTETQRLIFVDILLEANVGYMKMIAKLMEQSGLGDEELVALALSMKELSASEEGCHSAGRCFHDHLRDLSAMRVYSGDGPGGAGGARGHL